MPKRASSTPRRRRSRCRPARPSPSPGSITGRAPAKPQAGPRPPDPAARGKVKLRTPGALGYADLTATVNDSTSITNVYTGFVDVTAEVAAAGPGPYTVADVQAGTGLDRYAGWSLIVAYSDPAAPPRSIRVFAGLASIVAGEQRKGRKRRTAAPDRRHRAGDSAGGHGRRRASGWWATRATAGRRATRSPWMAKNSSMPRTLQTTSSTARSRSMAATLPPRTELRQPARVRRRSDRRRWISRERCHRSCPRREDQCRAVPDPGARVRDRTRSRRPRTADQRTAARSSGAAATGADPASVRSAGTGSAQQRQEEGKGN